MNAIIFAAVTFICTASISEGHYYRRTTFVRPIPPQMVQHRVILSPITRVLFRGVPTMTSFRRGETVYPTQGHGPFYRPNFPANINTFHPQGLVRPGQITPTPFSQVIPPFVVPREGRVNFGDVSVMGTPALAGGAPSFSHLGINSNTILPPMDINRNAIIQDFDTSGTGIPQTIILPGEGFGLGFKTSNLDIDGKPIVQVQDTNENQNGNAGSSDVTSGAELPVITPVVITEVSDSKLTGTDHGMTFPDVAIPATNQIFPGQEVEQKKNSSCHTNGCDVGAVCVFAEEYICPGYIPSVTCECRLGCRLDYTFIPLGGSVTVDVCGNTCSCNNIYGATECTQRMCKPEEQAPSVSVAGTVSSDADLGGFQGAFDSISEFPAKSDSGLELPVSASLVTVPVLQQIIAGETVVEKIVRESPFLEPVSGVSASETAIHGTQATREVVVDDVKTKTDTVTQEVPLVSRSNIDVAWT